MELITNDYRFRSFSSLYSRLVAFWMALSMIILLAVLFSNSEGGVLVMMFSLFWCVMLFAGIIACAVIRKQIRVGLRHCVQSANEVLIKNNIMAGVEDKGQLSCHKVVVGIEEKARQLVLKYSQDYVKSSARYRIIFPSRPSLGVSEFNPKHCPKQLCLCQFIDKNHFNRSPRKWYSHLV
ncbi:unnamed protein product [Angiostrongylus costaricensis]|uniref:Inner membrane protein n=1 Tax=Angiostrongylus costaricensis TaxID=334426 RepID=A0A0R3PBW1_ANGCS|nr:unnamed protein product [Angiostrongylus costaricensis]